MILEDPRELEDWEDILLWKESFDILFFQSVKQYLFSKIEEIPHYYLTEYLSNKGLTEISSIPGMYEKEHFIDDEYKISGLFTDNEIYFFVLEKDNKFYKLEITE